MPLVGGIIFWVTNDPLKAIIEAMITKRPSHMAIPSPILKNGVLALSPAKAEPLLLAADTHAYKYSVKPWADGLFKESKATG